MTGYSFTNWLPRYLAKTKYIRYVVYLMTIEKISGGSKESFPLTKKDVFLESKITVVADNGKNNLVKKFVPRLFGDYVTKMGMKMLVMIDQDSESPQDIFHRISGNVAEKLKAMSKKSKSMSFKYSADPSDYLISAQSEANPSDYFVESRVFIVPKSLEMQIALVAYKKLGKTPKGLDSISPHDAIEQTSKELGLSVEELIEEAARDYHRDKRAEWVGELIRILENYFCAKNSEALADENHRGS